MQSLQRACQLCQSPVSLRVYPDRLVIVAEVNVVAEYGRVLKRHHDNPGKTIYGWRHYLAVVQRKLGALRNGAPFLELPDSFKRLQGILLKRLGGDREMANILILVLLHYEQLVEQAIEAALQSEYLTKQHVLNCPELVERACTTRAIAGLNSIAPEHVAAG